MNRRRMTLWLVSARLSYCPHCMYLCRLCPMFSGTELSAVLFGQQRSPDLNPCDFFFQGCPKDKIYNSNSQTDDELKKIFIGKLQIFLQNSFKG
jgi:hypothetical protein